MPLLRRDFVKMFDSIVGESKKTARSAIKMAESIASCVSGSSFIYDIGGTEHTIDDLLNKAPKFDHEPLYIYAFNESSKRVEKTRVRTVVRQPVKKIMIRVKTVIGSVEVTKDHKIMVNRDGEFIWIEASSLVVGDLVMTPKTFFRSRKECAWKDSLSIKYESFPASDSCPHALSAKIGDEIHSVSLPCSFNAGILYYIVGMIDAMGSINSSDGISSIEFVAKNWNIAYAYASSIANMFMIEPSIESNENGFVCSARNQIASDIFSYASSHLFQQSDEVVSQYLSGFFDAAGEADSSGKGIRFMTKNEEKRRKIKKALHVFGILSIKETAKSISVIGVDDIEVLCHTTNNKVNPLFNSVYSEDIDIKTYNGVGFKLGKTLSSDRESLGISKSDLGFSPSAISKYEKDAIIPLRHAWAIAEKLQSHIHPSNLSSVTKTNVLDIVCSDIVGVKVTEIKNINEQWAYDLSCEGNHNFFANDILCHNCVL